MKGLTKVIFSYILEKKRFRSFPMPNSTPIHVIEHKMFNISFPSPDKGVNFHWCYQNCTSMHEHDFYEFVVFIDGKAKHLHNGKSCIATKGMLFLIKPGEFHQFLPYHNSKAKHINFSISPTMLKDLTEIVWNNKVLEKIDRWEIPHDLTMPQREFDFVMEAIERLSQNSLQSQNIHAIIKSIILQLTLFLADKLESFEMFSNDQTRPEWLNDFLKTLSDPTVFTMKLKDIYPLAPYSQSMLNSYFNKYVGSTLISYITTLKISYACTLLRHTDSSPLEISNKLAYDSLSHFNRVFKKITGTSPIAYRKQVADTPIG